MKFSQLINESIQWESDVFNIMFLGKIKNKNYQNQNDIFIPINEKLIKSIVGNVSSKVFHITDFSNIPKIINLQGSTKPLSCFTDFSNEIFKSGVQSGSNCIFILKANILASGLDDMNSVVSIGGDTRFIPLSWNINEDREELENKFNNFKTKLLNSFIVKFKKEFDLALKENQVNKISLKFFNFKFIKNIKFIEMIKEKMINLGFEFWKKEFQSNKKKWKDIFLYGFKNKKNTMDYSNYNEFICNKIQILEICIDEDPENEELKNKKNILKLLDENKIKFKIFNNSYSLEDYMLRIK
jgi:hypothetical protein